VLLSQTSVGK